MLTLRPLVLAVCLQFSMLNANFGKNIHNIYQATLTDDSDLQVLDTLLENYDRRITPNHHLKKPTKVLCEMYIRSLGAVSPATMDFEVDLYLRQTWTDNRMRSPNLTRPLDLNDPNLVKKVWRPDVYFPNAKYGEFQYVTVPNVLVRINPDGKILYMLRLKLTFSCMMDMERYPLDSQVCTIELASFSKTTKEVELDWLNTEAVLMYRDLKMAQFELKAIRLTQCKESFHIGEYSCLRAEFDLKRSIGHHLVQSYLPTILIVVISWVSFWLDVDAIPARITLGVTTLLTISSESSDQQANLAPVSYVKALDVWMGTCTMFVFAALLEFTFVNYLARKKIPGQQSTATDNNDKKNVVVLMTPKSSDAHASIKDTELPLLTSSMFTPRAKAKKIDQISRVAFPIGFVVFNALYWPYYLT
ncbi:glycine receptor subunit alpha-2-like [Centruroides vittatus]|uniref:glycine receptor subunit alpha-2-like n=1 Tax=Centruroides vittatus TaxID=120091 RepID=UPI00350EDE8D